MIDPVVNRKAKMYVPVSRPDLGEGEAEAVRKCVARCWISQGEQVERFEEMIASAHGRRFGIACNSGTTALHLALVTLGIGPGSKVAIPTHTMVAVANAVLYTGAKPLLYGGDDRVGNFLFEPLDQLMHDADAVIVPHTYGIPCLISQTVLDGLPVIEDCAEAHYAELDGKVVGSFGDLAVFSFYANKIITTGEGGMVLTDNEQMARHLRSLRSHAFNPERHFDHRELAFGYRMTDLQASIGVVQHLKRGKMLSSRHIIADAYRSAFDDLPWLDRCWQGRPGEVPWVYPIQTKVRDQLREHLADAGIDTRTYFKPLHMIPFVERAAVFKPCGAAIESQERMAELGMYLPLFSGMTTGELNYVIETVRSFDPG
jgi:perosamine synthetase